MSQSNLIIVGLGLCVLCSLCWRAGGSYLVYKYIKHNKLVRRIGCTLCCVAILALFCHAMIIQWAIALIMIYIACISYFGFINYIVRLWWQNIEMKREYWFNFLAEALTGQCSYLIINCNVKSIIIAIIFSCLGAFGKVFIDKLDVKHKDVYSELWFGFILALGLFINCIK